MAGAADKRTPKKKSSLSNIRWQRNAVVVLPQSLRTSRGTPPVMSVEPLESPEQPCLEDSLRQFLSKYNRLHTRPYYEHKLLMVVCCPSSEDEQDHNVLLQKTNLPNVSVSLWRLPEIDVSDLPGSTGINDSLKKIVMQYCGQSFASEEGQVKLLFSTKGKMVPDKESSQQGKGKPTLKIYVVVCYSEPQVLNIQKGGEEFELKSVVWLQRHEGRFGGVKGEIEIVRSAVKGTQVIDSVDEEAFVAV